jgi:hypothetical protein
MRLFIALITTVAFAFGTAAPAGAWGALGHRIISAVAMTLLPETVPAFLRTPDARNEVRLLGPEADNLRGAGLAFNADRDAAHFLDLDDDGTIAGVVPLANLPQSRQAYESALHDKGRPSEGRPASQWDYGYVPYEIIEGYEQVERDFAYWRVESYGEQHAANAADRTEFAVLRRLRERLTLRDIGYWSHFVADGSQPLHITIHYNGWGNYPNPQHYSTSDKLHAKFETTFVNAHASEALVAARVGPYAAGTGPISGQVSRYLLATNSHMLDVYKFEGAGAFDAATPEAVNFTLDRVADGARALRNWIVDAYAASAEQRLGRPTATVRDIESGKFPQTPASFGD